MWVRREDWERVTLREELVGRFRLGSRLPQYLSDGFFWSVMGVFGGWMLRKRGRALYDCYVYGSGGAGAVDLLVRSHGVYGVS